MYITYLITLDTPLSDGLHFIDRVHIVRWGPVTLPAVGDWVRLKSRTPGHSPSSSCADHMETFCYAVDTETPNQPVSCGDLRKCLSLMIVEMSAAR